MHDPLTVRLGSRISPFQCLQYECAREFPDYKKCTANNLMIDLFIDRSHDPSMYTISMILTIENSYPRAQCEITLRKFTIDDTSLATLQSKEYYGIFPSEV